ncbi:uncharacterized protein F4807DRAFT_3738 [Annulohypoxylon truncatum]|uniref:uncharacterized protein n=1 Tax=Annulohypoxylon truncatum TaxID=327061 RepID=UPI002008666D|nr:uncharacterized protein F4807DRAFT_3738 [Annulohypoxylon truncatum]KAI1214624.1 hypothetical protein F4807DRAFT_3738 [Annulohypoxylon truncatum]
MQFSKLTIAVLSAILTSAAALPASGISATGEPSSTAEPEAPDSGFQLKDVQVHCPDNDHQKNFLKCYNDNSGKNCDPMPDQADRHACSQLWQIMCANRIGCQVQG